MPKKQTRPAELDAVEMKIKIAQGQLEIAEDDLSEAQAILNPWEVGPATERVADLKRELIQLRLERATVTGACWVTVDEPPYSHAWWWR